MCPCNAENWISRRLFCATVLVLGAWKLTFGDGGNWPQFRGPTGQGHAVGAALPITWSETENVVWRTPLPGRGHSSPVIWGEQVWVTTDDENGARLSAVCVDRDSGGLLHHVVVFEPAEVLEIHADNTYASPTPVIEAGRLYVHYGRYGTACLDTASGNVLWRNDELIIEHQGGPGSSPVLFEGLLIVNCDGADEQYVVALDKASGRIRWRQSRSAPQRENPIYKRAFSTPLLVDHDGARQLVSVGADQTHAYDPRTGDELWHVRYVGFSTVPAPVAAAGRLYLVTGFFGPEVMAVRMGGRGNVTASHLEWKYKGAVPETPSPLLIDDRLFLVSNKGVASAVDVATGERVWLKRLGGNFSASPITDGQHLFFFGEDGSTHVVSLADAPAIVSRNQLTGGHWASPAVSGDALFVRTGNALYRLQALQAASAE